MTYKPANPPATIDPDVSRYLNDELNRLAYEVNNIEGGSDPGPSPGDPRDTVAFIVDPSTINGFGVASVSSITQGWRVTFTNAANSRYEQSILVQPANGNNSDRYTASINIVNTTQCDVYQQLVNVDPPVNLGRLFFSIERTLL